MKKMVVAICDDVHEDAVLLGQHLKQVMPDAESTIFHGGEALLNVLEKDKRTYHVIFLAIQMAGMSGISVAEEIRKRELFMPIIFVSGSDAYYREAFDVFAFQYLLKPVKCKELDRVLKPLLERQSEKEERVLNFRYRSQLHTLRTSQIVYISSSLHTVNFHMADGSSAHCRGKLDEFEGQLQNSSLLRCHQSFFVNMDYIVSMKTDSFTITEGMVPISRSYSKDVQRKYKDYLQKRG